MLDRKDLSKRIAQIQEETGLNGIEFANRLGTSPSYLSDIKNKQKKPSIDVLEKLSEEFKINLDWLLRGIGEMFSEEGLVQPNRKRMRRLPILGEVQCGIPISQYDDIATHETLHVDNISTGKEAFVLVAKGDSMLPYVEPNDKLVCIAAERRDIRDGDLVIVSFRSGVGTSESNCKTIRFFDRDNRVVLFSLNTQNPPQEYLFADLYKIYKVKQIIRYV